MPRSVDGYDGDRVGQSPGLSDNPDVPVSSSPVRWSISRLFANKALRRVALAAMGILLCCLVGGYIYLRYFRYNHLASCANCRKFMWYAAYWHAEDHDGWFPNTGGTPYESLSAALKDETYVRHFASHAMQGKLLEHWKREKKLAPEFCCYEYVQGFHLNDPSNLVMFYTKEPSYWECSMHKKAVLGRAVGWLDNSWEFLPEEEFQRHLKRTEDFLRERGRVPGHAKAPAQNGDNRADRADETVVRP